MTVSELIELLKQYPPDIEVETYPNEFSDFVEVRPEDIRIENGILKIA
jgi:hypothetical protein